MCASYAATPPGGVGQPQPRRRKTPGRKPTFTRESAIEAALEEGIASFTLKAVAERLGVQPSALYRTFESRAELQAAAIEREFASATGQIPFAGSWQELIRSIVDTEWRALRRYPELPLAILTSPHVYPLLMPYARQAVDRLVELGFPGGEGPAAFALDFIGDTVLVTVIGMDGFFDESGTQMDRSKLDAFEDSDDVFGMQDMGERGMLAGKVEFIIAGIEHGILPPHL